VNIFDKWLTDKDKKVQYCFPYMLTAYFLYATFDDLKVRE